MISPDENYAEACSGLWEVFGGILCVESDKVMHSRSLSSHIGYELLELFKGDYVFQNDYGGPKEKDEFEHRVQTAAGISPALLMP